MQDEEPLVARWHAGLHRIQGAFDEFLVIDGGSKDGTVAALELLGVRVVARAFSGSFAEQRNFAVDQTQSEWIFELDADEVPSVPLLSGLRTIVRDANAAGFDCIGIPRLNFHDCILQPGPGYRGLDYQYRLHRHECRWHKPVHEEISGWRARFELDLAEGHFIQHLKTATRYEERNALYRRMEAGG